MNKILNNIKSSIKNNRIATFGIAFSLLLLPMYIFILFHIISGNPSFKPDSSQSSVERMPVHPFSMDNTLSTINNANNQAIKKLISQNDISKADKTTLVTPTDAPKTPISTNNTIVTPTTSSTPITSTLSPTSTIPYTAIPSPLITQPVTLTISPSIKPITSVKNTEYKLNLTNISLIEKLVDKI